MKRMPLLLASLLLMAASFSSCKPSRVWATKDKKKDKYEKESRYEDDDRYARNDRYDQPPPPPAPARYYPSVPLVISPTPGFTMNSTNDGRYYHRSPQGFLYWKAYDNRFFIDRSHLNRISYTQWDYQQWRKLSGY